MAVAARAGAALRRRVQSHPGPGTHWLYTTVDSRRPSPAVVAQRSEHSIKMHTDVSWYRVSVIREPSIIGSSGVQVWSCRRVQDAPWPSCRHPTLRCVRCGRWRRRRLTISLELPLGPHAARGSHAACMRHRWVMSGWRLRVFSPAECYTCPGCRPGCSPQVPTCGRSSFSLPRLFYQSCGRPGISPRFALRPGGAPTTSRHAGPPAPGGHPKPGSQCPTALPQPFQLLLHPMQQL